jgi:hypothetical protein
MQAKMRTKSKKRAVESPAKVQPKSRAQPSAKLPIKDNRHITINGKDAAGKIVATDRTDAGWKAGQVAAAWRASRLTVEVIETGHSSGPILAGAGSQA